MNKKTIKIYKRMGNYNHLRNRKGRIKPATENHPIINLIRKKKLKFKNVLEIGCSTGFILQKIYEITKADCYGIDISKKAIIEGKKLFKNIKLFYGFFESSNLKKKNYDLIILGFFLFLLNPNNILNLFSKINDSIKPGGLLIIYDFYNKKFHKKNYKHEKKLSTYRYDFKNIFLSVPNYELVYTKKIYNEKVKDYLEVSLLKKKKI